MTIMTWGQLRWLGLGLALVATAAAAEPDYVRIKVDTANVREGPGTKFELATQAFQNEPLQVVNRKGRWLNARTFEGTEGWVYAPLTDDQPAAIVKGKWVNVRSGPGTNHQVLFTAERGVSFRVLEEEAKWLKVEHADGDQGWIHKSLVWGNW